MRPRIFLSYKANPINYTSAVVFCGGICGGGYLPEITDGITQQYDGLLLCGGPDVHPRYFGEDIAGSETIDEARDVSEFMLMEKFIAAGKPILGICRGHQLINVYFGGSIIQDLPTRNLHTADEDIVHTIHAVSENILSPLYGESFSVNSAHHQAVNTLGKGLRATHYSVEDQVIEGIEHQSLPILGVQWHPERMSLAKRRFDTVNGIHVIQYFVDLCGK